MPIKILDTHTINKIAAGEVVERPCSVVKELVENSVDAKASSITVEIKNGGVDLIRVTDNGIGIPKEQVEIAFLRHATSKIIQAEDLYEVKSLGFRGEALASIAAVSHIELFTKVKEEATGKRVQISGGKIISAEETACPEGTTFIMRHLFYNVPARKAFLMSMGTEAGKIADYMYKLALAHPEISFQYIQNGKRVFNTSGDHQLKHCVLNIYGKQYAKETIECYYKQDHIECVGLLGKPILNRSNRNYEHFFINGRYIKSQILQNAVEDAYKTFVMVGKFPFVVLHLNMDPSLVDVNVHPTKLQVRFKNIDLIYRIVYEAVSSTMKQNYLVPEASLEKPKLEVKPHHEVEQLQVDTFFTPRKKENTLTADSMIGAKAKAQTEIPDKNPYKPSMETVERLFGKTSVVEEPVVVPSVRKAEVPLGKSSEPLYSLKEIEVPLKEKVQLAEDSTEQTYEKECQNSPNKEAIPITKICDYRIVGQLFKTYWLVEYGEKVLLIDQHAAHERILFEQFMNYFKAGKVATQLLLVPETLKVTPAERVVFEENEQLFKQLGFSAELFGEREIAIREVPYLLNEPLSSSLFKQILDEIQHQKVSSIADVKAESIIRMSCRSAIKAHDSLTDAECHGLIEQLMALENPFTCPHGRPTIVSLKQEDLEKMFKRI